MTDRTDLPAYRDLPRTAEGVGSAWGMFGAEDELGLMNLLTPERVLEAAALIRHGRVFRLDLPLDFMDPPLFRRGAVRHHIQGQEFALGLDDVIDNYYPQSGSQWDSLAHVAYDVDRFYNGATTAQARAGRNTIEKIAERGIVGRGVLLDVSAAVADRGGPGEAVAITPADLEEARVRDGVEIRTGDLLLIRTGFPEWFQAQDREERRRRANPPTMSATGLDHTEELVAYLWDLHVAGVASDTAGGEVWPADQSETGGPIGFVHRALIGALGMMLGELWRLDELAADCRADGRFEFFVASSPLRIPRGIGSPANALAIK